MGNTACEVSVSLVGRAAAVYQAYRRGRVVVSRLLDSGVPTDSTVAWPALRLKYMLDDLAPRLTWTAVDGFMERKMVGDAARLEPGATRRERRRRARRRVEQDWRLTPCATMAHAHPAVQEHLFAALRGGRVVPLGGFRGFAGPEAVLVAAAGGVAQVRVDAVIFCTSYTHDWSLMPAIEMDGACGLPASAATDASDSDAGPGPAGPTGPGPEPEPARDRPARLPRLYQFIFPPRHAASAAVLSYMAPQESVWCVAELAAMAVAQIWAAETARAFGPAAMDAAYHAWWLRQWAREPSMRPGYIRARAFYRFLHRMAGTGLYDGGLARPLRLCWADARLFRALARGPVSAHAWRPCRLHRRREFSAFGSGPRRADLACPQFDSYQAFKQALRDDNPKERELDTVSEA